MLEIKHLSKTYTSKHQTVYALKDINLYIQDKGMVFILGKSGSGKSTLLNVLGGLDQFDEGEICIGKKSSKDFKQSDFDSYRNTFIGFIFQEYNVMDNFTVKENIALALQLQGKKADENSIQEILKEVDLEGLGNRKPNELSGGQLQRVAIARALIKKPEIIMADEPTGALDSRTGKQVLDTLKKLSKDKLVLIVSHDKEFAKTYADRIIELRDGQIISDTSKELAPPNTSKHGISLLEERFMNIPHVENLTEEDYKAIIEEIRKHQGEIMISFHADTNKEIKKLNHIAEDGQMEVFHPTKEKHLKSHTSTPVSFIKSKLPFNSSMKLALSNLKLKPFRLLMTILLSVSSFTMFGLADTMSRYNRETTTYNSMKDTKVDYIAFGKSRKVSFGDYSYDEAAKLTNADVESLKKQFPQAGITNTFSASNYQTNLDLSSYVSNMDKKAEDKDSLFYPTSFSALSTMDEDSLKKNNFTLLGHLPKKENELAITTVQAKTWKKYGFQNVDKNGKIQKETIRTDKDLLGKQISLLINKEVLNFTISGIVDTKADFSRYEALTEGQSGVMSYYLTSEFDKLMHRSYHTLGFVNDKLLKKISAQYHVYTMNTGGYSANVNVQEDDYAVSHYLNEKDVQKKKLVSFEENTDVYLDYRMFSNVKVAGEKTLQNVLDERLAFVDSEEYEQTILQVLKEYQKPLNEVEKNMSMYNVYGDETKVDHIGLFIGDTMENDSYPIVLSNRLIEKMGFEEEGSSEFVISPMVDDEQLKNMISYSYTEGKNVHFSLDNQVMPMLSTLNSIVDTLKPVFFYMGIGFAIFASVLFCNFIATSIANKKREIGILRAVGARGVDVLKIFLTESILIALINWILAVFASGALTAFINGYIRNEFQVLVTVLNFGLIQVVLLLMIAIVIACIASAFPVLQISRKKPIDAIKDRK